MAQASLDWRTVERIKKKFKIPLAIKGIATAEDAALAVEHGVDWIYVSNHGGRQLDHGRGSLDVLPEVVDAVAGRAKIIVDGSICRGTDIVKAIATGADLVGIGRMQCFALAAAAAPAWCGCSNCSKTKCSAVSACWASRASAISTARICTPPRRRTCRTCSAHFRCSRSTTIGTEPFASGERRKSVVVPPPRSRVRIDWLFGMAGHRHYSESATRAGP